MNDDSLDRLLVQGAQALRRPPQPELARRVMIPLRARRRAKLLRIGAWSAAAAALLLAVIFAPSPFGSAPSAVEPARTAESGAPQAPAPTMAANLPAAEPEVVEQELVVMGRDARAAVAFLGQRVPLVSRFLAR